MEWSNLKPWFIFFLRTHIHIHMHTRTQAHIHTIQNSHSKCTKQIWKMIRKWKSLCISEGGPAQVMGRLFLCSMFEYYLLNKQEVSLRVVHSHIDAKKASSGWRQWGSQQLALVKAWRSVSGRVSLTHIQDLFIKNQLKPFLHFECISYNSALAGVTGITLQTLVTSKEKKKQKSQSSRTELK